MRAPRVRDLDGFKGLGVPTGIWWEVSVEEGEFERHAGLQMAEKALSHVLLNARYPLYSLQGVYNEYGIVVRRQYQ